MRRAIGPFPARFRFLRPHGNICQFQKAGAAGITSLPGTPGAIFTLAFERETRRDPQVFGNVLPGGRSGLLFGHLVLRDYTSGYAFRSPLEVKKDGKNANWNRLG